MCIFSNNHESTASRTRSYGSSVIQSLPTMSVGVQYDPQGGKEWVTYRLGKFHPRKSMMYTQTNNQKGSVAQARGLKTRSSTKASAIGVEDRHPAKSDVRREDCSDHERKLSGKPTGSTMAQVSLVRRTGKKPLRVGTWNVRSLRTDGQL